MNDVAANVERVVREVLAELGVAQSVASRQVVVGQAVPDIASRQVQPDLRPSPASLSNDYTITSRIVTMNDIAGRLNGARRVVVEPGAIVTPAVRDELLRRGIALAHAGSRNGQSVEKTRVIIVTSGTKFDPAALVAGLQREKLIVETVESQCIIAAVDQLAAEIKRSDTLGVLLTDQIAAGLCLANRLPGVRAITGPDAPSVAMASEAVGANLLVVNPAAGSFFQLKQLAAEFCRGGVRPCPAVFCERLR